MKSRLQMQLRDALLEALWKRDMRQADLARKVGISQKHLTLMLNGRDGTEGTLSLWQELFDAVAYRVDIKTARKPKVEL